MPELLVSASSPEAVIAAVQNGADAVCFSYGGLVPKSRTYSFTKDEFRYAAEYCRVRGVRIYADLTGLIPDEGFSRFIGVLRSAASLGADAVILDELGALRAARAVAPELPVHMGPRAAVSCLASAELLASLGAARAELSPFLTREQAAYISLKSPIETQLLVQGPLCAAQPGSCLMSAFLTGESENRNLCSQPCLEEYFINKAGGKPLSSRDLCLVRRLEDIEKCSVSAIRIGGGTKRPEYAALMTAMYAKALRTGRPPEEAEIAALTPALSLRKSTDAFFTGDGDAPVLGEEPTGTPDDNLVLAEARRAYLSGEYQRVPLTFAAVVKPGLPVKLAAEDDRGIIMTVEGPLPSPAGDNPITYSRLKTLFHRTDGTPYTFGSMRLSIDEGLELPSSVLTNMLRSLLDKFTEARREYTPAPTQEFHPGLKYINPKEPPAINVSVVSAEQLTKELAGMKPALLYVPLRLIAEQPKALLPFWGNDFTEIVASLPRCVKDGAGEVRRQLEFASRLSIKQAEVQDAGHIALVSSCGLAPRGGLGLNVYNSQTMRALKDLGLLSAALSCEMSFKQIREISKAIDAELLVYGRVPLMTTARCVVKSALGRCACENQTELLDRRGAARPVLRAEDCGSTVYSASKLLVGRRHYRSLGLSAVRLGFTTENPSECVSVMSRYLGLGRYEPTGKTRGMYPRGIE